MLIYFIYFLYFYHYYETKYVILYATGSRLTELILNFKLMQPFDS